MFSQGMFDEIKKWKNQNKDKFWSQNVNISRSNEYIMNNRNQKLHVRSYWPKDVKCKSLVIFLHGYASHCNRPLHKYISLQMNDNSIGYITIDISGHGYSDGLKGYIDKYSDPIDDIISLLICLYTESSGIDFNLHKIDNTLPFYLIGHSMGGAISILIADILSGNNNIAQTKFSLEKIKEIQELSKHFKGLMLLGPAIKLSLSPVVRFALDYVLQLLMPESPVPGESDNEKPNDKNVWSNDDYYDYVVNDGFPKNPNGLSWGPRIRCRSCSVLFDMSEKALICSEFCNYPFLIFHDPLDSICKIDGSRQFYLQSKTSSGNTYFSYDYHNYHH